MKPNLTQPSNDTLGDTLFSIFTLEFETRGVGYFNWLAMIPEITGGILSSETPLILIKRLAANPSIISVLLNRDPEAAIEKMIYGDDNDIQVVHITDFLDDITINCRLRDPELFARNEQVFLEQLRVVSEAQTNMNEEEGAAFDRAMKKYGYLLMTLHYLRKIGYIHVLRERRNSQA